MTYVADSPVARNYRQLGIQHDIETASPHRLIQMLMERVLTKVELARRNLLEERMAEKGRLIGDAINIVNGLQASLNHKADEKMSANFDALYAYMMRRLLEANLRDEVEILDEVSGLLQELKEAWDAIAEQVEGDSAAEENLRS